MTKIEGIKKVLFVCSGNTCRSPMAEYLFRHLCEKKGLNIEVISRASLDMPVEGRSFSKKISSKFFLMQEAEEALLEYDPYVKGIKGHIPRSWASYDIKSSGLILTMDCLSRDKLLRFDWLNVQDLETKVYTLKEYAGFFEDPEIEDPLMFTKMMDKVGEKELEELLVSCNRDYAGCAGKPKLYDKLYSKSYAICRDEILKCLLIILDGKEAAHEDIIKNRILSREALSWRHL